MNSADKPTTTASQTIQIVSGVTGTTSSEPLQEAVGMAPVPIQIISGTTGMISSGPIKIISGTTGNTKYTGPNCRLTAPTVAWPAIILALIGGILVVYTAIAPGVDTNARIFGIVLLTLWTIMWALILWVLWRGCRRSISWWLLLIPLIVMGLFFVLIIIMNMGSSL